MHFSLVFEVSGDSIPFQTVNSESADLLCYYVENLNSRNLNRFLSSDKAGIRIKDQLRHFQSCIQECNKFVYELLDEYIQIYDEEQYLDQDILNKIHADWVHSQNKEYDIQHKRHVYRSMQSEQIHDMFSDDIPVTSVGTLITKLGFKDAYNGLNLNLHKLEECLSRFKFIIKDVDWFQIHNPFSKSMITNDISNFCLGFHHLGRTLYNKFVNHDIDLMADDENTYNELLALVELKLEQPQTIPFSSQYTDWAKRHNRTPTGDFLNIGNIPDLSQRLTTYRKIIYQNTLQEHSFSLQLTKG